MYLGSPQSQVAEAFLSISLDVALTENVLSEVASSGRPGVSAKIV